MKFPPLRPPGGAGGEKDPPGEPKRPADPKRTSSGSFPTMPKRVPPDPKRVSSGSFPTVNEGPPARRASSSGEDARDLVTVAEPAPGAAPDRRTQVYAAARDPGDDAMLGRVVGQFRIEKLLGRGGMAVVYLARQLDLDREVAVKVLSAKLTADPRQVDQFAREARALAKLEHPNVVTVYAFGKEEDGVVWLAAQLVRGGSLRNLLDEKKKFSPAEATSFVAQIGRGLLEAHKLGIVHRDIKPDNVLVGAGPTLKITDFGLARMAGDPAASFGGGEVVGTPHYMSPEQVDAMPDVDGRTDIYALGATFYHLLTGVTPFKGASTLELLLKHVNEPLVPPHERPEGKGVSAELSRIVCRMMAKDRAQRYATLDEVLRDLEAPAKAVETVVAKAAEVKPSLLLADQLPPLRAGAMRTVRPRSVNYAAVALVAASALALGLGVGPLRAVLADQDAQDALDPAEEAARHALARLRPTLEPRPPAERLDALRRFVAARPATKVAGEVRAEAQALEEQLARERVAEATGLLDAAEGHLAAGGGGLGAALDALAAVPQDLRALAAERADALQARLEGELTARGVRWMPAGPLRAGEGARARTVVVTGLFVDRTEVTCAQYARFVAATSAAPPAAWGGPTPPDEVAALPVTGVSLRDAAAYALWRGGRVPTAVEWEKAARGAPEPRTFPWGDDEDPQACNWAGASTGRALPAGSAPRDVSPYGCVDMAGNVAELTVGEGGVAAARGGSFLTQALACTRGAFQQELAPTDAHAAVGFRCVYDAAPAPLAGGQ
jgi:serine/threonine protein kinase/formylglycine-generating enzyme required for sulfatase activity